MARQITKENALLIRDKLCGKNAVPQGRKHDTYAVRFDGKVIGKVSIRRGSEKDQGHDFIAQDLNVPMGFAKELGLCTKSFDEYVQCLRDRGHVAPLPEMKAIEPEKTWKSQPWYTPKSLSNDDGESSI